MGGKLHLTGHKYNRWTVIGEAGKDKHGATFWICQCDCGKTGQVRTTHLRLGVSKSCGCLQREVATAEKTTHGLHRHPLYDVWYAMHRRTSNPDDPGYPNYGGRGISVCGRWSSLENFVTDMGPSYRKGLTIDRVNNDGNYEPGNCRWTTRVVQQRNRTNTVTLTYLGKTLPLAEWADIFEIKYNTLHKRVVAYEWSTEKALTKGVSPKRLEAIRRWATGD